MLMVVVIVLKGYCLLTVFATFYNFCIYTGLCAFTSKCDFFFFSEYCMERQSFNRRFVVSLQNKNENERSVE